MVQVLREDELGRKYDPISLTVGEGFVVSFSNLFNQEQQDQIAALQAERTVALATQSTLQDEVATLTMENSSLSSQVASIPAMQQRIATLESLMEWNTRWIQPEKFISRFTALQAMAFYESTDPVIFGGRQLLSTYVTEKYQIDLDDAQVTGLLTYMVSIGIITDSDRTNILRDSSRDERYVG